MNFLSKPFYENGIIFNSADALWSSFQDSIAGDFAAMSVVFDSTTYRPNYADIDGVLDRSESLATLGCGD